MGYPVGYREVQNSGTPSCVEKLMAPLKRSHSYTADCLSRPIAVMSAKSERWYSPRHLRSIRTAPDSNATSADYSGSRRPALLRGDETLCGVLQQVPRVGRCLWHRGMLLPPEVRRRGGSKERAPAATGVRAICSCTENELPETTHSINVG